MISSPYARRGELWNAYNRHFGPNGDPMILVAQAPSRVMNPSLPQSVVDRAWSVVPPAVAAIASTILRRVTTISPTV